MFLTTQARLKQALSAPGAARYDLKIRRALFSAFEYPKPSTHYLTDHGVSLKPRNVGRLPHCWRLRRELGPRAISAEFVATEDQLLLISAAVHCFLWLFAGRPSVSAARIGVCLVLSSSICSSCCLRAFSLSRTARSLKRTSNCRKEKRPSVASCLLSSPSP